MFRLWLRELFPAVSRTTPRTSARRVRPQVLALEDRVNPAPLVSIADVAQAEGNAGTSLMTFTVSLDVTDKADVTVDVATADGTATAGSDYVAVASTVTILAGNLTQTFTVTINGDTTVEADETFTATLSNVSKNASIAKAVGTGTILDDDTTTLTVSNATLAENGGSMLFTVTSSNAVQGNFTVDAATAPLTATPGVNYTTTAGTLTFTGAAAGQTQTFSVPILNDGVVTGDKTFQVNLANPVGPAGVPASKFVVTATAVGTITNIDKTTLTVAGVAQAENAGPTTFTVTSSAAVSGGFTVNYSTADGTATVAGSDYTAATGTLTFAGTAGESKTFTVAVTGDTIVEADETFTASLTSVTPPAGVPASAFDLTSVGTATIVNDDAATVTINSPAAVTEGTPAAFVLTLSNMVDVPVTVTLNTGNLAPTTDADHAVFVNQVVTIPANTLTFSVPVATVDDAIVEPTEQFTLTISAVGPPTRAVSVGVAKTGTATILDNDTTTLTVSNVTQLENAGPMLFTVTSSNAVQGGFAVNFATADGTAVAGPPNLDYTTKAGKLNFVGTANESQTFSVPITADTIVELDETFTASLNTVAPTDVGIPTAKFVITSVGTGTIQNDDVAVISVSSPTVTEGGNLAFVFTLTNPVDVPVTFEFTATDGTAKAGANFTPIASQVVTIPANTTSKLVTVATVDDRRVTGAQSFTVATSFTKADVTALGGRPVTLNPALGTASILDNDTAVISFSKAADAYSENNQATTVNALLTITATGVGPIGLDRNVTASFTPGGTAAVGLPGTGVGVGNYLPAFPAGVTFPAGDGTAFAAPVTLTVFENLTNSGDLTATVTLGLPTDPTGGQITVDPAQNLFALTILNDDAVVRTYDATVTGAYRLVRNGPNVELYNGASLVAIDAYGTAPILLNGTAGDDSLQIDYSGGNPVPAGGVTFDGKGGNDRLTVTGGSFAKIASALTDANSGAIAFTDPLLNGTVSYRNLELETLLDPTAVGELNFALPAAASTARLQEDGGVAGNGKAEFVSLNATFLATRFVVPAALFSADRGTPADAFEVTSAGPAASDAIASVRVGTPAAPFAAVTISGTLASNNAVELNGKTIAVNAPLSATNSVRLVAETAATQAAAITTNTLQLGVGGPGNYTLTAANKAVNLGANTTGNVAYTDADAINLVGVGIGGSFDLSAGTITQSAPATVAGATTLTAGPNPITLADPANDFSSVRVVSGGNVALADANALVLAGVAVAGNFSVSTTNGAVTQTAPVLVSAGATTLSTGTGNVTLTDPANDFNSLTVTSGGTDTVRDANALTLLGATLGALDVQAVTDLLVTGNATATVSSVGLRAGNLVRISPGVVIRAATTLAIAVTSPAGGLVDLRGADLVAAASTIDGGTGADTFQLTGTTTPVAVNGHAPTGTPTGDELDFFAQGKDVFATPNSFNTAGAPVSYLDIEIVRLLNPAAVTLDGTNGDDVLRISRTPTGPLSYRLNGDVPVEAVGTTRFRFNGLNGADSLIANFAGGSPVPAGGVLFDGGAGNDVGLCVLGAKNTANFTTTAGPGLAGRVTVDGSVIDFINFETTSQVDITNMAKVTVGFATADDNLTVGNGFDATAGKVNPALIVSGPATPRVGLWNNTDVTLDTTTTDGNDTITVASADNTHGNTNLTILTGNGNDTVAVTGGIAVDGNLRIQTQSVSVTGTTVLARSGFVRVENAKTLTLSGATITAGTSFTQASGGPVALVGQSTATAKAGDIAFTGTIDGPGGLAANTAGATLFDQAVGANLALSSLTTDAPGATEVRGKLVRTSGVQSYGDPVTFTQSGTQFLGTSGSIAFGGTLDPAAAGFDLTVGGPNVNVTFANAVGSKAAIGTLLVPDANTATLNGPVTATSFVQTQGSGTTTVNGPLTATGTTPVTGYIGGGAINIGTKAVVFAGAISAPNAPIVLRLSNGATQPGGQFTTTKLYLNGAGDFALNQPGNVLTNGTADLFADLTSGSISVRDSSDLAIRFEDPSKAAIAITGGGNVTLITGRNFTAEDPRASATARENGVAVPPGSLVALFNVGGGTVQVFFSVGRAKTESATVLFVAEAKAGQVILGQAGTGDNPNGFDNVTKDSFIVRPALGTKVIVNGNLPVAADGPASAPFDSLSLQLVGIGAASLVTQGAADGTFSFPGSGFQPLVYTSIESFEGRSAETFSVQTAPRIGSTASTSYAVRVRQTQNVAGQSVPINSELGGTGIIPNPFVVSPSLLSPLVAYTAPKVTLADVNGDGTPDLIIANGAGDSPAITIIDGTALNKLDANGLPIPLDLANLDPAVILAQFFPFEETFRGGLSVATGDFDGDGKLEIVVGAGIGGGPRVEVFKIDSRPTVVGGQVQLAVNGDGKLVPIAFQNVKPYLPEKFNFFAFEPSQRGGVNVTVGYFNDDNMLTKVPDIVVGAGPGGAPRVRIIDGKTGITGPSINDFFAYDSGFRGGVFVDAGRYDTGSTTDLVTAPGAGGGPHVKVFLGSGTAGGLVTTEVVGFMAYDFPTGLVGGADTASAFYTGVGGVAFGAAQDVTGSRRAILVTSPRGSEFSVTRFDSTDDVRGVPTKTVNYQQVLGSPTPTPTTSINLGTTAAPDLVEYNVLRDGGSASGFATSSKAS